MAIVYIGLGSNLGERKDNLERARFYLEKKMNLLKESSIYQTPPWGYLDQPEFFNQVVEAETKLPPLCLLKWLKRIEKVLGRTQTFRYGPRVVDLDILFYSDRIITRKDLQIPHPRLHERAFVLVPLAEIAPDLAHPVIGLSILELVTKVNVEGVLKL